MVWEARSLRRRGTAVLRVILLAPDNDMAHREQYPRMFNLSTAPLYPTLIRADMPEQPECLTLPMRHGRALQDFAEVATVAPWNSMWEAAKFRRRLFDENELPAPMAKIANRGDVNVTVLPRTRSRYYESGA
jgi:hypothetical protein